MKATGKKQITVKDEDLEGMRRNALLEGRTPAFCIEMGSGRRWVIITEDDFDERFPPD